ncbi:eosinophil peroxidase-like [Brachionichthys hirsutus]|uniref:eosinophil peroxidase-like n=1 Tax=Brachionichthys hirsutus TaxID=412623 RepID=UPI003604626F
MKWVLSLIATGLYLCWQSHADHKPNLNRNVIEKTVTEAKAIVDSAYEYSRKECIKRVKTNAANPSDILLLMKQPLGQTRTAVRAADYMNVAVNLIKATLGKHKKCSINTTDVISEEDLHVISDLTGCTGQRRPPSCKTTANLNQFRTITSICNNRKNTLFGSSNIPLARWLTPEYQDQISLPRGWDPERRVKGKLLPLVREVSNQIVRTTNDDIENDPRFTYLLTIFAQWIDHDLTLTPHSAVIFSYGKGVDCEKSCDRTEPCFPIQITRNDPRFGRQSDECIPFFRSAPACGSGNTGHIFSGSTIRQQMNSLTAFIDASQVYGSVDVKARSLRDLSSDKGLLRVNAKYNDNGREFLPFSTMDANMCATRAAITNDSNAREVPCFVAGDERANENIALTSLHTLFLREHNRLVRALAKLNPYWDGERLYQEARKIMGAYFQIIIYRDFLPIIVGPDIFAKKLATYPGYDEHEDPSISNVFATAAFRFAHLMVQPFIFRLDEQYNEDPDFPNVLLHRAFFTPWRAVFEDGLDSILRGLVFRPSKLNTQDQMMHDELRERLFEFSSETALDLASLNMQRGRDHGIPGYRTWRRFCNLSEPSNRKQLGKVLKNKALADRLLDFYGTPSNIDVWLGGVAEPFVPEGRVGPLFACLITTQFQVIRNGDRFWWENPGVFTEAQRRSLRSTSLARIICDNTGITKVPLQPLRNSETSTFTDCNKIPAFDLSPWEDNYIE